jgi:hypothetical protein
MEKTQLNWMEEANCFQNKVDGKTEQTLRLSISNLAFQLEVFVSLLLLNEIEYFLGFVSNQEQQIQRFFFPQFCNKFQTETLKLIHDGSPYTSQGKL